MEETGTGSHAGPRAGRRDLLAGLAAVDTLSGLARFAAALDRSAPFAAALGHACDACLRARPAGETETFRPGRFLSADLSAVRLGEVPAIFLGTNDWALLRFATEEELDRRLARIETRLAQVLSVLDMPVHLVVVPEKDALVERIFAEPVADPRPAAVRRLLDRLQAPRLSVGYDGFAARVAGRTAVADYAYPDSHLLSRDYVQIFHHALTALGLIGQAGDLGLGLGRDLLYGDLAAKFDPPDPSPHPFLMPRFEGVPPEQTGGSASFEDPLRATAQSFARPSAPIDARVAVFGDSHGSIFAMRKLTFLFAHAFRHCAFVWDPMHLGRDPAPAEADVAILEISERFLFGGPLGGEVGA